jgi:ATP-binding cassette, subfamily A (ABC1), member 5
LYKTFHSCRKPEVKAVNGINLTIYAGQITAILGHNGAGKSTLFNILTGLTGPTSGTAYIFGYDIRDPNDMSMIRQMTGVCPQHDILFDTLTAKEHLYFFAAVRGISRNLIDQEVMKTLKDIDLLDTANSRAKNLSGGQKRKLSIGIAIIGDPKIIILDEPSAGVDPYSRRHLWSILQTRKHGKVILLTTHFMDEADILADRKAVISRGKLRCCGSSLFLKNKFGIGYHLTLVLDTNAREAFITKLVNKHVPKAVKARRHGRELSYILPHDAVDFFAPLFEDIEREIATKTSRLGICSYGVSMTTLEEVFLHLETEEGAETETSNTDTRDGVSSSNTAGGYSRIDSISKKIVKTRTMSRSLSLQGQRSERSHSYHSLKNFTDSQNYDLYRGTVRSLPTEMAGSTNFSPPTLYSHDISHTSVYIPVADANGNRTTVLQPNDIIVDKIAATTVTRTTKASIKGRRKAAIKNFKANWMDLADIKLKPSKWKTVAALLKLRVTIITRDLQRLYLMIFLPLGFTAIGLYLNSIQVVLPVVRSLALSNSTYDNTRLAVHDNTVTPASAEAFSELIGYVGEETSVREDFGGEFAQLLDLAPNMGALDVNFISGSHVSVTILYNDTEQHSLPIILNLLSNTILQMYSGDDSDAIEVSTHPFQQTSQPQEFNIGTFSSALFVGMIFVLVPVSLAVDMVYDREMKAKNQLRVNGLPTSLYFTAYFIVLIGLMLLICAALLGMVLLFDIPSFKQPPALITLGILIGFYTIPAILCSTCFSYIFDRTDSAQSILPNILTFVGLIPFILVAFLDMLGIGEFVGKTV